MSSRKIRWLCETALMIALLVVLQFVTKPLGQLVTGSCVNAVLSVAVLMIGLSGGICVALLSPFFAFLLGIGPQLFPITPAIAAGNTVLVLILWLICRDGFALPRRLAACLLAAMAKFIVLYLLVVKLMCSVLPLADKQIATFSAMFSWPQLITALIGSSLALIIVPRLKKLHK